MRNQWSFRTKSRLKVVDNSVKISQVIGKKNSNGDPFYPSFTNTTVVLVSEDKRTYETTKATADGAGNLTFLKRGLADDGTDIEVAKFKKAWMPGTLMYVTFASEDYDKKADISSVPTKTSDLINDSGFIDSAGLSAYAKTADLGAVALSNDYNDLNNKLTAGANVNIDGNNEISATDTTYTASDFDIKDLADTTSLRTKWSGKQDALVAGANIQIAGDGKTISATDTIPNNATIKVQKNGTDIESFTANESTNKTINITVPVTAADVSALPASTKYGATVDMSINSSTYVVTLTLKDQDGNTLGTAQTIDLPLESVVVSGSYDDVNKKIVLTLQSGSTIEFSVADLVSGLQTEITSSNKLSADLVDDSSTTNKFVTASDLTTLSNTSGTNTGDQVASDFDIKDLTDSTNLRTQRSSKQKGVINVEVATGNSTAAKVGTTTAGNYSPAAGDILLVHLKYGNSATAVTLNIDSSGAKAIRIGGELTTTATFTIPNQTDMYVYLMYDGHAYIGYPTKNTTYSASNFDIKDLADSTSLRTIWNGKQDAISDLATIRTGAGLGATAVQPGDDVSDLNNDAGYLTSADLTGYQTTANMVQDLDNADHDHYPTAKAVQDAITSSGGGDMLAATYDPNNVAGDAFDTNKMNNRFFYGESSTAAATVQKEVSIPSITSLNVGQVIIVKPSTTSTVASSTLKLNSFPAYKMLYNGAEITTSTDSIVWSANVPSLFYLDEVSGTKYWRFLGHGLDNNTTYTINYLHDAGKYKAGTGTYAITRYSLCMMKADGTWEKLTATNANYTTATTKTVNTNGFVLNQIKYYNTTTTIANGAFVGTNAFSSQAASVRADYSFNCGTAPGWSVGDPIYIVGTIGADGLFYLDTTARWTTTLPSTNDGKLYIRIGVALTTTDATISFLVDRPIFYYDNGIKEYTSSKQDKLTAGTGINISSNTISNTGVTSVNGNTGAVTVAEFEPDNAGSTDQVLTKTADGYEWQSPASGGGGTVMSETDYGQITPQNDFLYFTHP